jgi:hypothetical protein
VREGRGEPASRWLRRWVDQSVHIQSHREVALREVARRAIDTGRIVRIMPRRVQSGRGRYSDIGYIEGPSVDRLMLRT